MRSNDRYGGRPDTDGGQRHHEREPSAGDQRRLTEIEITLSTGIINATNDMHQSNPPRDYPGGHVRASRQGDSDLGHEKRRPALGGQPNDDKLIQLSTYADPAAPTGYLS
jgi:hypothetical protein